MKYVLKLSDREWLSCINLRKRGTTIDWRESPLESLVFPSRKAAEGVRETIDAMRKSAASKYGGRHTPHVLVSTAQVLADLSPARATGER